jgi:hypothetical protein
MTVSMAKRLATAARAVASGALFAAVAFFALPTVALASPVPVTATSTHNWPGLPSLSPNQAYKLAPVGIAALLVQRVFRGAKSMCQDNLQPW